MKKTLFTALLALIVTIAYADGILIEGFEYANHDGATPIGWTCMDQSWLCGYQEQDHNRIPHTGNWYAYTNADESWMFMPLYLNSELKYRFSSWTISDGAYELEFWAGSGADPGQMTHRLATFYIDGSDYEKRSVYIESLPGNFDYFGIRAMAHEGAAYLTIDDIQVDMVARYEFTATPINADTVLYPGSQASYHFSVQNIGYTPIQVILSPSHEFFRDFHYEVEGTQSSTFHLEPEESKEVIVEATLLPSVQPGTTCWLDIMLLLDCDCATAMTTLWVTVIEPVAVEERHLVDLYPNPSSGTIHMEGAGLVTVSNTLGQVVMTLRMDGKEVFTLPKGLYIVRIENGDGIQTKKLMVE